MFIVKSNYAYLATGTIRMYTCNRSCQIDTYLHLHLTNPSCTTGSSKQSTLLQSRLCLHSWSPPWLCICTFVLISGLWFAWLRLSEALCMHVAGLWQVILNHCTIYNLLPSLYRHVKYTQDICFSNCFLLFFSYP